MVNRRYISLITGLFFIFFCGFFSQAINAQTEPAKKPLLNIQYWKTSQGTPVYFVKAAEIPMIDIRLIFNAGSVYDGRQWGIASLAESMVDQGTDLHDADQIADIFDQNGAQFSSDTNRDVILFAFRSLTDPQYLNPALNNLIEILGKANFPGKSFDRIQQQTLTAIHQQQEDPSSVASDAFFHYLYNDQGYGHPILGTESSVKAITPEQAKAFYHQYVVSSNAKIVIVGNIERNQAEQIAQQLMNALPKGSSAPQLALNQQTGKGLKTISFPSQQTTIVTGQLGIDRQNPNYFPLMVGNYLLGVMPLNSLLFEQVRGQQGLVYGIFSNFDLLTYRGPFEIVLQTRNSEKNKAIDLTRQVLTQYTTNGPTSSQLETAKQNIINHFPLNLATNENIASVLTQMAINQRPLDYLDTYQSRVNQVSVNQVKEAWQTYVDPQKLLTVMVGN
ncbi:MAG: insulinase family protein [Proteobacteria bacterium]|nr:insulinase family protein [Pseudomonadota bacterium]